MKLQWLHCLLGSWCLIGLAAADSRRFQREEQAAAAAAIENLADCGKTLGRGCCGSQGGEGVRQIERFTLG